MGTEYEHFVIRTSSSTPDDVLITGFLCICSVEPDLSEYFQWYGENKSNNTMHARVEDKEGQKLQF